MGFDTLLGNDRLKENLNNALGKGRASHFYLLSGAPGSGRHTLAMLLSAALQCRGAEKPCLTCPQCRKVMARTHPDVTVVEDPEHVTVPIKLVRDARSDAAIKPNEGNRKIYIFPQELGIPGQNAMLKLLEEPPAYGTFLVLTDNPEKLLPTLRSRCVELKLQALKPAVLEQALAQRFPKATAQELQAAISRSGGYLGQAEALLKAKNQRSPETDGFAQALISGSTMELLQLLMPMEKWKREKLIPCLEDWLRLTQEALACRAGLPALDQTAGQLSTARNPADLMRVARTLNKAIVYTQGNVSPAAVCGWLEWALRS